MSGGRRAREVWWADWLRLAVLTEQMRTSEGGVRGYRCTRCDVSWVVDGSHPSCWSCESTDALIPA